MITATRETLVSTGEHIAAHRAATRMFGEEYSDDEYIRAVTVARTLGVGEKYADQVLGPDADAIVSGVQQDSGVEIVQAAERRLRSRGIAPAKASYWQYAAALVEVSP